MQILSNLVCDSDHNGKEKLFPDWNSVRESPTVPRSFHLSPCYLLHLVSYKSRDLSTSPPYLALKPGLQGYRFSSSPDYKMRWSASGKPLLITKDPSPALSQGRSLMWLPRNATFSTSHLDYIALKKRLRDCKMF